MRRSKLRKKRERTFPFHTTGEQSNVAQVSEHRRISTSSPKTKKKPTEHGRTSTGLHPTFTQPTQGPTLSFLQWTMKIQLYLSLPVFILLVHIVLYWFYLLGGTVLFLLYVLAVMWRCLKTIFEVIFGDNVDRDNKGFNSIQFRVPTCSFISIAFGQLVLR